MQKKRLDAKWEKGKQKIIQEALPGFCGFATKKRVFIGWLRHRSITKYFQLIIFQLKSNNKDYGLVTRCYFFIEWRDMLQL